MQSISISKLLRQLYGIDPSVTRFMTHKDVIGHFEGLEKVSKHDEDFIYKIESGEIVKVKDSKNKIEYYYINRTLFQEAEIKEEENYDNLMDNLCSLTKEDLENMNKYELEDLRSKMKRDRRIISGCYDDSLSDIKKEIRKRSRRERGRKK